MQYINGKILKIKKKGCGNVRAGISGGPSGSEFEVQMVLTFQCLTAFYRDTRWCGQEEARLPKIPIPLFLNLRSSISEYSRKSWVKVPVRRKTKKLEATFSHLGRPFPSCFIYFKNGRSRTRVSPFHQNTSTAHSPSLKNVGQIPNLESKKRFCVDSLSFSWHCV